MQGDEMTPGCVEDSAEKRKALAEESLAWNVANEELTMFSTLFKRYFYKMGVDPRTNARIENEYLKANTFALDYVPTF
jgi:hypothetical protein